MRIKIQTRDGQRRFWFVIDPLNTEHSRIGTLIDYINSYHNLGYYNTVGTLQDFPLGKDAPTFSVLREDDLIM